jgi:hypothetical protein
MSNNRTTTSRIENLELWEQSIENTKNNKLISDSITVLVSELQTLNARNEANAQPPGQAPTQVDVKLETEMQVGDKTFMVDLPKIYTKLNTTQNTTKSIDTKLEGVALKVDKLTKGANKAAPSSELSFSISLPTAIKKDQWKPLMLFGGAFLVLGFILGLITGAQ